MTTFWYSVARGRPAGRLSSRSELCTWVGWWKEPPREEPFRKPDAWGGCLVRSEALDAVREQVAQLGDVELVQIADRWATLWRRIYRQRRELEWARRVGEFDRVLRRQQEQRPRQRRRSTVNPLEDVAATEREWRAHIARFPVHIHPALAVLGLGPTATVTDVRRAFRALAKVTHPDVGGSTEAFRQLHEAFEQALKVIQAKGST